MGGGSLFGTAEVGGSRVMQALVVDDSAVYRKLIGDYLRSWGFGVTLAVNGTEAWRILEQPDSPKLALLDWVLPDLDGIELCKRIRQADSSRPYVYVMLLTSNEGRQKFSNSRRAQKTCGPTTCCIASPAELTEAFPPAPLCSTMLGTSTARQIRGAPSTRESFTRS